MKNINLLLLVGMFLLLGLTGCRKESSVTSVITQEIPDEEPALVGKVSNAEGDAVAEVKIQFYQEGNLIGETITDENGIYTSLGLELLNDIYVNIYVTAENGTSPLKRVRIKEGESIVQEHKLYGENDGFFKPREIEFKSEPDLVEVSGSIFASDESVVPCHVLIIYDFDPLMSTAQGQYAVTDENGRYSFWFPPGKELQVMAAQVHCYNNWLYPLGDNLLGAHELGLVNESIEVETIYTASPIDLITKTISGNIICDGAPYSNAKLYYNYFEKDDDTKVFQSSTKYVITDTDGAFTFEVHTCQESVDYYVSTEDNPFVLLTTSAAQEVNVGANEICEIDAVYSGQALAFISNDTGLSTFENESGRTVLVDGDYTYESDLLQFAFSDLVLGNNQVSSLNFEYEHSSSGVIYTANEDDVLNFTIDSLTSEKFVGLLEVNIYDASGGSGLLKYYVSQWKTN